MRLSFDSIDEVREFVKGLKGTRGGKNDIDEGATAGGLATAQRGGAPAPRMPDTASASFPTADFPGAGAAPGGAGYPAAGVTGPGPEVVALVQRIAAKIDWAMQPSPNGGGQPADAILNWFRGQCGPETASYTMDQIKQVALPRASVPTLENIAKLMNA